jgi:hypothetical protein
MQHATEAAEAGTDAPTRMSPPPLPAAYNNSAEARIASLDVPFSHAIKAQGVIVAIITGIATISAPSADPPNYSFDQIALNGVEGLDEDDPHTTLTTGEDTLLTPEHQLWPGVMLTLQTDDTVSEQWAHHLLDIDDIETRDEQMARLRTAEVAEPEPAPA